MNQSAENDTVNQAAKRPGEGDHLKVTPPSQRRLALLSFLLQCLHLALPLSLSIYLSYAIPALTSDPAVALLPVTLLYVALALLAYDLMLRLRGKVESLDRQVTTQWQMRCSLALLDRPHRLDLGYWRERIITDLSSLVSFRARGLPQSLAALIFALATFALQLVAIPTGIALVLAALALLLLIPPFVEKNWAEKNYEDTSDIEATIDTVYYESNQGLDLVKTEALSQDIIKRLRELDRDYLRIGKRAERTGSTEDLIANSISQLLSWGSLFFLLYLAGTGPLAIADVPAVFVAVQVYYQAMQEVFSALTEFFVYRKRRERLRKMLDLAGPDAAISSSAGKPALTLAPGAKGPLLATRDLSLGREERIFSWPDLAIEAGEKYRLAGPNGSGKTTLFRVLSGLETEYHGEVKGLNLVGDGPPRGIAVFLQTTPRLRMSGQAFVKYLAEFEPAEAQRMVALLEHFFSAERWEPLSSTEIANYSGGERQIFFLAYCLAKPADLFLLDEPDDQLDGATQKRLEGYLESLDQAVLLISHHERFCQDWPLILVANAGGEKDDD